jgi:hypothetical protein
MTGAQTSKGAFIRSPVSIIIRDNFQAVVKWLLGLNIYAFN